MVANKECDLQVLAELLLKKYAFIYEDMDRCDAAGAYHSDFMLQLFGRGHLSAIHGYANVPALKTQILALKGMSGAISLCAAAVSLSLGYR